MKTIAFIAFCWMINMLPLAKGDSTNNKHVITMIEAETNLSFRPLDINITISQAERFWIKVEKTDNCWLWKGAKWDNGYGAILIERKLRKAHRISWLIHFGPIPGNLCVCHKCDVKNCVRPDHLFLGTHGDNMRDMESKGRAVHPSGESHAFTKDPSLCARGERCKGSIFTNEQVLEIRRIYKSGKMFQKDISEMFGTNQGTISAITRRHTWTHI